MQNKQETFSRAVRAGCSSGPHLYNPITVCRGNRCGNLHQLCSRQVDLEVPVEVGVKAVHEDIHLFLGDLPWRFLHRVPQSFGILGVDGVENVQGLGQAGHGEDELHGGGSCVQPAAGPHGHHPAQVLGADGQAAEAAVESLLEPAANQGRVALGPVAQEQGQAGEILGDVLGKVVPKHGAEPA